MFRHVVIAVTLLTASFCLAAERTVLFEEFTNAGCPYCWQAEPSVNSFVNGHLSDGNLAVIRVHVGFPASDPIYSANPTEQNARKTFYGVSGVPSFRMDGSSTSSGGLEGAFSSALSEPTDLAIAVARNGDETSGTVSIRLIAEAELPDDEPLRLFATLVEDSVSAGGSPWPGQYFFQAFRDNLFGAAGPLVAFTGPYPDTLYFESEYSTTGWDNDQLYLATFVQQYSSTGKDVINANWSKFMDLGTGIEPEDAGSAALRVATNPSSGPVRVETDLPGGEGGFLSVYDMSGRLVWSESARAVQTVRTNSSGVYLVVLRTGAGETLVRRVAVIR